MQPNRLHFFLLYADNIYYYIFDIIISIRKSAACPQFVILP